VRNEELFERARRFIPGGVNSPVRAFKSVGGVPRFVARAEGPYLWDVEGNRYVDFVSSWGPLILGHAQEETLQAITEALERGWTYGAPTEIEVHLAELVVKAVPSIEKVRMVNSGTEATMSALRLARAYTGRRKVIKFAGCYHGHADSFLVAAGSGLATLGVPSSPGVTPGTTADTVVCRYNDLESVEVACREHGDDLAAIIVEPVAGNMGVVPPKKGFLEGLRRLADETGSLLIFDEVITGFRLGLGGAQERYGVTPDLTTLGKILGGGFPVGAFGGKAEIMDRMAPEGPVYQAGTLSGNPVAMTAGYVTLSLLQDPKVYRTLEERGRRVEKGLRKLIRDYPMTLNRVGSMFTLFFTPDPVTDFDSASRSDTGRYGYFFHEMLSSGFYLAPSQFEACFISMAHDEEILDRALDAVAEALERVFADTR
jgi:glutamate-1-semialdehyde 2,1-aminomutase